MLQKFLDFLFPRRSLTGTEGEWITEEERAGLRAQPIIIERDALGRQGFQSLDRLVAACAYRQSPLVRKALHTVKYKRSVALVAHVTELLSATRPHLSLGDRPVLCAVPMHWIRRFARGFNQAELLGKGVAERFGLPFRTLLRRTRATGSQVGRGREERVQAVRAAFAFRAGEAVPSHVILVDDICTTGGTLDACARTLKDAGVTYVEGFVVAKD